MARQQVDAAVQAGARGRVQLRVELDEAEPGELALGVRRACCLLFVFLLFFFPQGVVPLVVFF